MIEYKLSTSDKQLLHRMNTYLEKYLTVAAELSPEAWEALSETNAVIWRDVEAQQALLNECILSGVVELLESAELAEHF